MKYTVLIIFAVLAVLLITPVLSDDCGYTYAYEFEDTLPTGSWGTTSEYLGVFYIKNITNGTIARIDYESSIQGNLTPRYADVSGGNTQAFAYTGTWHKFADAHVTFNNEVGPSAYDDYSIEFYNVDLTGHSGDELIIVGDSIGGKLFEPTNGTVKLGASDDHAVNIHDHAGDSATSGNCYYASRPGTYTFYYDPSPIPCYSADITANKVSGALPLYVTFADNSSGFPETAPYATYTLDFDDGSYWEGDWQYSGEYWFHLYEYPGTYNVSYAITYSGTTYTDYIEITVSEAEANYYVQVSGLNTAPIEGAGVYLYYNGVFQDSEGTSPAGRAYFDVPTMTWVNGTVNKSGYYESSFSQYINTWDTWTSVVLYTVNETPSNMTEYGNHIITFRDANTGELVTPVTVSIYSDSGYTDLFSTEIAYTGVYTALIPLNTLYYYDASSPVYHDLQFSSNVTTSPTYSTHYMSRTNPSSDIDGDGIPDIYDDDIDGDGLNNDVDDDDDGDGIPDDEDETPGGGEAALLPNLHIWVYDTLNHPINGALVSVVGGTDTGTHSTNATGYTVHYCNALSSGMSRTYSVTVTKGGYTSQTISVTVSTQNPTLTVYLSGYSSLTATPTPTMIYTPVITPVWSGTNGTPGSYKEQFLNFTMSQFGVDQFSAGVLIGLVLTLLSAVFVGGCLAGYGSGGNSAGIGAMIGGAFGWIASGMLGFIPLWALIVTVALVAMVFFIFLRGGGSGGG